MNNVKRFLVIGANGQIGSELVGALALKHGAHNVIAADIAPSSRYGAAHYETLNVLDSAALREIVAQYQITHLVQLAAMLSASGEQAPLAAWDLNMNGLLNSLELARLRNAAGTPLSLFWPSSIAAFGPNTPRDNTPQLTLMDPSTMYGISKLAGELLCDYYFHKYGVDVRSLRYPGVISHQSPPGGGTTDYAIAIFHAAVRGEVFECYLNADATLPMIYMLDAIRATIALIEVPAENIKIRSAYNIAGFSFSPQELAREIQALKPDFEIRYKPDQRQDIAASWPHSIDDSAARRDWGWQPVVELGAMVGEMLNAVTALATTKR